MTNRTGLEKLYTITDKFIISNVNEVIEFCLKNPSQQTMNLKAQQWKCMVPNTVITGSTFQRFFMMVGVFESLNAIREV